MIAASRFCRSVSAAVPERRRSPSVGLSQFPTRRRSCGTPFTRRMPATSSGLSRPAVGRLVGQAPHCGEPNVNRRRGELLGLQLQSIPQYDGAVQCQARFRAIPFNEFVHRMLIRSPGLQRCQAVKDGTLGLVEFRQSQPIFASVLAVRTFHRGGLLCRRLRFYVRGPRLRVWLYRQKSRRCGFVVAINFNGYPSFGDPSYRAFEPLTQLPLNPS